MFQATNQAWWTKTLLPFCSQQNSWQMIVVYLCILMALWVLTLNKTSLGKID